ncbi:DUF1987 domain-containing protein [Clostridium chromiireducens]|uniref:DUF1987 domain-containing protein n=1 Tax=Clostridium chromiireducens TaxID=225345 RepID=A0A1V4IY74_9CLOT|nr:DUF1987 domain-containing protein [Clostridium chromiireducens]OPJ64735.1 hypothetical protein CLCHR_10880 [Clostridium chromiireducens]RII35962.1 DUF1987 domain-containing protein [Clostridium chromiireducens]
MNDFITQNTKSTPYVEFINEQKRLIFKGESYPENAYNFYEPIYKFIDEYLSDFNELIIEFQLSYINTSSIKCLIILFDKLNENYQSGKKITINWYYDEDNGFDYDMGQDFSMDIDIPFNFISISDEE